MAIKRPNPETVGRVGNAKEFAHYSMELTDEEVTQALQIIVNIQHKYATRQNTAGNLEQLRDEALTRLAEIGILATLDPAPCFYGDPPELEIIGKIKSDPLHTEGFDHEKKQYEVRKAVDRGEEWLGQKEPVNPKSKVKRSQSDDV